MGKYTTFMDWKSNQSCQFSHKSDHRFDAIPIKIKYVTFVGIDAMILIYIYMEIQCMRAQLLSRLWLSVTLWTVARQATYTHTHTHAHTHTQIYIYTHIHKYIYIHTYTYTYIHIYTHIPHHLCPFICRIAFWWNYVTKRSKLPLILITSEHNP